MPFGLTIEDLPGGVSKLRNRVIGRVFHALGFSRRTTRTRLARLVGRGLVREIGTGPQDPRRRYFLAEQGPA